MQIATKFAEAPLAYLLSALAGVVYILATIGLAGRGPGARRLAWAAVGFELVGVLVVGTFTVLDAARLPRRHRLVGVRARIRHSCHWCSRSSACGGCGTRAPR